MPLRTLALPHGQRHILQVEGDFAEVTQEGEAYCAGGTEKNIGLLEAGLSGRLSIFLAMYFVSTLCKFGIALQKYIKFSIWQSVSPSLRSERLIEAIGNK